MNSIKMIIFFCLKSLQIENYGIPADLSLSPRESVQLYDTMVEVWNEWPRAQVGIQICGQNI